MRRLVGRGNRAVLTRRLAPLAATLGVTTAIAHRARQRARDGRDARRHADVAFMRAVHAALRRDAARLDSVAPALEPGARVPDTVTKGWEAFRDTLHVHHAAEDDDLWPVLRRHLADDEDLRAVDAMVEEHHELAAAVDAADAALAGDAALTNAAHQLGDVLGRHLDHEEARIFPLLREHLSHREWRQFLITERDRRPARERSDFLTWVLDDASPRDAAAVLTELPRPAHVLYRWLHRPRYAAEHRWQTA